MTKFEIIVLVVTHLSAFVLGALVFRNNLSSANNLIARGKAIYDTATGKIVVKK